jgi:hypothetical protein
MFKFHGCLMCLETSHQSHLLTAPSYDSVHQAKVSSLHRHALTDGSCQAAGSMYTRCSTLLNSSQLNTKEACCCLVCCCLFLQITFMRSNEHSKDRQGSWDVSKLPGPDSPLHKPLVSLVKGDEKVGAPAPTVALWGQGFRLG